MICRDLIAKVCPVARFNGSELSSTPLVAIILMITIYLPSYDVVLNVNKSRHPCHIYRTSQVPLTPSPVVGAGRRLCPWGASERCGHESVSFQVSGIRRYYVHLPSISGRVIAQGPEAGEVLVGDQI